MNLRPVVAKFVVYAIVTAAVAAVPVIYVAGFGSETVLLQTFTLIGFVWTVCAVIVLQHLYEQEYFAIVNDMDEQEIEDVLVGVLMTGTGVTFIPLSLAEQIGVPIVIR